MGTLTLDPENQENTKHGLTVPPQETHLPVVAPFEEYDYEALPDNTSLVAQLSAGAFAGIMEHSLMYPIDVIKTRMQLVRSGSSVQPVSSAVWRSLVKVSTSEGVLALWKGVSSMILGAGPSHAVYFGVFEYTKTQLVQIAGRNSGNLGANFITHENHPLIASISGISATVASDALMTPFDVIKQRMQSTRQKTSMFNVARNIYTKESLKTFWISYPATLLLNIPFSALNFGVYEYSNSILNPTHDYSPSSHCISGAIAGATAAAITNPFDFIKTLLQTKGISKDTELHKVNGFKDAFLYAVKKENGGWRNFLKGIRPRVLFNIPSTAISWTTYEAAKSYLFAHQQGSRAEKMA